VKPSTTELAASLVVAVADRDPVAVGDTLRGVALPDLRDLAILLAGHVNVDRPFVPTSPPLSQDLAARGCLTLAAATFNTTIAAIRSKSRRRDHIDARHTAAYAARLCGLSFETIGAAIGCHHTTVMHAVTRVGEDRRLHNVAVTIAEQVGRNPIPEQELAE
jgi:1,6-anhydro-N-acetylmuramate kinase